MSRKERARLTVMVGVKQQELTLAQAAVLMRVGYRQCKRIWRRYQADGDAGLVHRLRGQPRARRKPAELRTRALARYAEERYADFGPTLMAEHLAKEKLVVDHETLRRWRLAAGQHTVRRRKPVHRQWRERKPCFGALVQLDGSHHDWFEGRGPKCVLMVMVDDATNQMRARFFAEETTHASYDMLAGWGRQHGLPGSLYVDRDSIYRCEGVASIAEQLAGINDMESANRFLEGKYLRAFNRQFARAAASPLDQHRAVPRILNEVLSWEEERVVAGDWTGACAGTRYQLDRQHAALSLVRRKVIVRTLRSGRVQLVYRGQPLKWRSLPAGAVRRPAPAQQPRLAKPKPAGKPPAQNHPWRRLGGGTGRNFWNGIKAQGRATRLAVRASGRPSLRSGLPASRTASRRNQKTKNKQPRGHSLVSYRGDISKEF